MLQFFHIAAGAVRLLEALLGLPKVQVRGGLLFNNMMHEGHDPVIGSSR